MFIKHGVISRFHRICCGHVSHLRLEILFYFDIFTHNQTLTLSTRPSTAMIGASALLTNYEVGPRVEACFQNFAAGLIISAGANLSSFFCFFILEVILLYVVAKFRAR